MTTRAHFFSAGVDVDAPTGEVGGRVRRTLLPYSGVDDKRERAGLSSQSSGWLGARGNGPIVTNEDDVVWSLARGLLAEPTTKTSNGPHTVFYVPGLRQPFFS